jgi:hypothetical protein
MRSTDFPFAVTPQRLQRGGKLSVDYSAPSADVADLLDPTGIVGRGRLEAREPSWRDQLKDKLAVRFGRRNAEQMLTLADFTPAGAAFVGNEAALAVREGKRGEAAANVALAALPLPGAGKAAKKVAKAAKKRVDVKTLSDEIATPDVTTELIGIPASRYQIRDMPKGAQAVWLEWIESGRKGAGAEALKKLSTAADRDNLVLRLSPDNPDLVPYYERFGFQRDPAGGEIMERMPAAPPPRAAKAPAKKPSETRFAPPSQEPVVTQAARMGLPLGGLEQLRAQHTGAFGPYANVKPRKPFTEIEANYEQEVPMQALDAIDPQILQDALLLPLVGDRTMAGRRVVGVEGIPTDVATQGGPLFGVRQNALGSPAGWASFSVPVTKLREKIAEGLDAGRDVFGVYTAMGPQSLDQTTMMTDLLSDMATKSPIRREDFAVFNDAAKRIIPNFAGLGHADLAQQLATATQGQRKRFVDLMDTSKMLEKGFPDVSAARVALTEEALRDVPAGTSGYSVVKFGPESFEYLEPTVPHPSYDTQMTGEMVGRLPNPTPFSLMFPKFVAQRREVGMPAGSDLRALELRKPTEVYDQEALDNLMAYLMRAYPE